MSLTIVYLLKYKCSLGVSFHSEGVLFCVVFFVLLLNQQGQGWRYQNEFLL